jgi:hypothetical protein
MAKCYSCGKELSLFSSKASRIVDKKKKKFCPSCAEEWDQKDHLFPLIVSDPSIFG